MPSVIGGTMGGFADVGRDPVFWVVAAGFVPPSTRSLTPHMQMAATLPNTAPSPMMRMTLFTFRRSIICGRFGAPWKFPHRLPYRRLQRWTAIKPDWAANLDVGRTRGNRLGPPDGSCG